MATASLPGPDPLNINISAYRVLYTLLVLVQYRSLNVVELNRFLGENPLIQRIYNSETLTKYVNTLREVGCDIPRSSNRNDYCYELRRHPFPLQLEPAELQVAERLLHLLATQPDEALYRDYRDFLEHLSWSIDRTSSLPDQAEAGSGLALFPELIRRRDLWNQYRRFCLEAFTLALSYQPDDGPARDILLEPHELAEQGRELLLIGLDQRSQEGLVINLDAIASVRQLPAKSKRQMTSTTVAFALYGRLANSYRPYPGEKRIYQSATEVHIKTKVLEPTGLVNRLLKYGNACQVLSPAPVREAMRLRIDRMLQTLRDG